MKFNKIARCPECRGERIGILRDMKSWMTRDKKYICSDCGLQLNKDDSADKIIRAFNLMGKYKRT